MVYTQAMQAGNSQIMLSKTSTLVPRSAIYDQFTQQGIWNYWKYGHLEDVLLTKVGGYAGTDFALGTNGGPSFFFGPLMTESAIF